MNILFAGTPDFAVPSLKVLLEHGVGVSAIYTQPDRPAGRGRRLQASPVKQLAAAHGLPVLQPESLKNPADFETLQALQPDLIVVVAYGMLLPQAVLDLPSRGCINVHASLLPRWRGAAPIQRSILAGDPKTGVTIMRIEPKLDAGPILHQRACPIACDLTGGELYDRLATLGAEALWEVWPALLEGSLTAKPQDESLVTYAAKLEKAESRIDWSCPAAQIVRQVNAFNPWPVAETTWSGGTLRIWRAEALDGTADAPGTVIHSQRTLEVAAGSGGVRLLEVQLPGGKRLPAQALLNAHDFTGEHFS